MSNMCIKDELYKDLLRRPTVPPETGGILGRRKGVICAVFYDEGLIHTESAVYQPNVDRLNQCIYEWEQEEIEFCGMFHTHFPGQETLSTGDKIYIQKIMESMPDQIKRLYFPIVIPGEKVISYEAIFRNGDISLENKPIRIIQ